MTASSLKMDDAGIVIAAGGSGQRFGKANKLFVKLSGIPVFIHSIISFSKLVPLENIIISAPEQDIPDYKNKLSEYSLGKVKLTPGGTTRMESVFNALNEFPDSIDFVAVHDAARPLADTSVLQQCRQIFDCFGSAVAAKPLVNTLKRADKEGIVTETVDRSGLWQVETPQAFRFCELKAAYKKAFSENVFFTDDSGVMEYSGYKVKLFENRRFNIKITYPEDVKTAEAFLTSSAV